MRTVLITGASGFVGKTLLGMRERGELEGDPSIAALPAEIDIREFGVLRAALESVHFDAVIHLAAISFVPQSIERPLETYDINLCGTINLVEALKARRFAGPFLYVSSGDVYGAVPENRLPITEADVPQPRTPYAASKLAAEAYCMQAVFTSAFRSIIARPFNHIGPGQSDRFLLPAIARQISEVKRGERPRLETGNLDVTRDFSDVRDVINAYFCLLTNGRPGEIYNVCSGIERSVGELVQRMLQLTGVTAEIAIANERRRPNEQRRHYGSNRKLCEHTGWHARVSFEDSLRDFLKSWNLNT